MRKLVTFLVVSLVAQVACAQVDFPVSAPTPKVGDVATYRTTDLWTKRETSRVEQTIVEIQPTRFVTQSVSLTQGSKTVQFTQEWQPCRSMKNSEQEICAGVFSFPLQVGSKHKYEKLPWPDGNGYTNGDCEVFGTEKVTVAAGTFETAKVECSGYWNRVFGGTFSGRLKETYWYAPKISRLVKSQYTSYSSGGGGVNDKFETELIDFSSK